MWRFVMRTKAATLGGFHCLSPRRAFSRKDVSVDILNVLEFS